MKKKNPTTMIEGISSLHERVAILETHMCWVKKEIESIKSRTWQILAGIIISILVTILFQVF